MEKQVFINQVQRLKNTYGEKSFSDERLELMWDWAKFEQPQVLRSAVDEILESSMTPPSPAKIRNVVQEFSARYSGGEDKVSRFAKNQPWCDRCGKTGVVSALDDQSRIYAFQCVCPIGKIAAPSFKKWSPELAKKFKRDNHVLPTNLPSNK